MILGDHMWLDTVTEWAIAFTVVTAAVGVFWRKVVRPVRNFTRAFKDWMRRIEAAVGIVEKEMTPDSGSTLVDKVDIAAAAQKAAATERSELRADVKVIGGHIETLLAQNEARRQEFNEHIQHETRAS